MAQRSSRIFSFSMLVLSAFTGATWLTGCSGAADSSTSPLGGGASTNLPRGSSSSENQTAAELFDPPEAPATPDSIIGTWGGVATERDFTFDTRFRLTASVVSLATRCSARGQTSAIVGVTVAGRVSAEEIAVLESKKDERTTGEITCRANLAPSRTVRCAVVDGFQKDCFWLEGTTLTMYGATPLEKLDLIKISD